MMQNDCNFKSLTRESKREIICFNISNTSHPDSVIIVERKRKEKITHVHGTGMNASPLSKYLTQRTVLIIVECYRTSSLYFPLWKALTFNAKSKIQTIIHERINIHEQKTIKFCSGMIVWGNPHSSHSPGSKISRYFYWIHSLKLTCTVLRFV
jgi:hypothetical protein